MELITIKVKEKASGDEYVFDCHAQDEEQAIEVAWHVVEEEFGGNLSDYEFTIAEILVEPRVVSFGECD